MLRCEYIHNLVRFGKHGLGLSRAFVYPVLILFQSRILIYSPAVNERSKPGAEDTGKNRWRIISIDKKGLAERMGELIRRGEFDHVYRQTMERISQETGFFEVFKELGMWDEIYEGRFALTKEIDFNARIDSAGLYLPDTRTKLVEGAPVSREAILMAVAGCGDVPRRLDTAAHEKIHDLQYPGNQFFSVIYRLLMVWAEDAVVPGKEWIEVLAYRLTFPEIHEGSIGQVVEHLVKAGSGYEQMRRERVVVALELVDQLRALGLSLTEITELGRKLGGWDEQKRTYPMVRKAVEKRCEERRVEYPAELRGLVNRYRMSKVADRVKAQAIALEEVGMKGI